MIPENYTAVTAFDTKKRNKLSFQHSLGLMEDASIPLIGICARITEQKDIQFLIPSIEILLAKNCQLVLVGNAFKDDQFDQSILQSLLKFQSNFPHAMAIKPFAIFALVTLSQVVFETRLLTANKQRLLFGTSVCPRTVSRGFKDGAVVCRPPAVTTWRRW